MSCTPQLMCKRTNNHWHELVEVTRPVEHLLPRIDSGFKGLAGQLGGVLLALAFLQRLALGAVVGPRRPSTLGHLGVNRV